MIAPGMQCALGEYTVMLPPTSAAAGALMSSGSGTPPHLNLSECISELVATPVDEKLLQLASTLTHFTPLDVPSSPGVCDAAPAHQVTETTTSRHSVVVVFAIPVDNVSS